MHIHLFIAMPLPRLWVSKAYWLTYLEGTACDYGEGTQLPHLKESQAHNAHGG